MEIGCKIITCIVIINMLTAGAVTAETEQTNYITLANRLNLNLSGLEAVKEAANKKDYKKMGQRLLDYYRTRTKVTHPLNRVGEKEVNSVLISKMLRSWANKPEWADNAIKHIFVGQKSYPPHFCGQDIDWSTNPTKDNEWLWQLHRMYWWESLGFQYRNTGDEKYAAEWVAELQDWIKKNPPDEAHAYAWRTLESSERLKSWTYHFQYFVTSPAFTPDVLVEFLNSYYIHAEYVVEHPVKGGNIAAIRADGLFFAGIFFPEIKRSSLWLQKGIEALTLETQAQVYLDGFQKELSPHYHRGAINSFISGYGLAKLNGQEKKLRYGGTIESMIAALIKISLPDGREPQFGDAWKGNRGELRKYVGRFADTFNRDDFRYFSTNGEEGKEPNATAFALPYSGFYSMRSGWDESAVCLVMKCGHEGAFHCQPDNGTFELSAMGRDFMIDSGCYIYSGDAEGREWFRKTSSHQTLTLDGKDSAYKPSLLLWQTGGDVDGVVVANGSYENLNHRRSIIFVKKHFFVIVDDAIGSAEGDVRIHFQFVPCEWVGDNVSARTNFQEGANLLVQALPQHGMTMQQEEGWISYEYGKKEKRPAFCYQVNKKQQNIRFVTVLVPYQKTVPDVHIVSEENSGSIDKISLQVNVNDASADILCDIRDKKLSAEVKGF